MPNFFKHGGTIAWLLVIGIVFAVGLSAKLFADTMELRYQRDVNRMVFNDNLDLLQHVRAKLGVESPEIDKPIAPPAVDTNAPYIVVSIAENRLWFKQRDSVIFTARVATASGKVLIGHGDGQQWRFETPRGRLAITEKEENPAWVPPEWHYIEQARKRGLGLVSLARGQQLTDENGVVYYAHGSDIVRQTPDGDIVPVGPPAEGRELVVDGKIVVPPFGTNQRRYMEVLGTRRLKMPDGYAIHGTNNPASVGQSVSHGCIRMRNADIEHLYPMVPVGTLVYIY